jgi:hypothetical protein
LANFRPIGDFSAERPNFLAAVFKVKGYEKFVKENDRVIFTQSM